MPRHINAFWTSPPRPMLGRASVRDWKKRVLEKGGRFASSLLSSRPSVAYPVRIMPRAERDFVALYDALDVEHSDAAVRWFNGLQRAVFTLEVNPHRCPMTPENKNLRQLLYGRKPHVYRV